MILSFAHNYAVPFYKSVFDKTSETKFENKRFEKTKGVALIFLKFLQFNTVSLSLYARRLRRITIEISLTLNLSLAIELQRYFLVISQRHRHKTDHKESKPSESISALSKSPTHDDLFLWASIDFGSSYSQCKPCVGILVEASVSR
jgi:hypothetical protein